MVQFLQISAASVAPSGRGMEASFWPERLHNFKSAPLLVISGTEHTLKACDHFFREIVLSVIARLQKGQLRMQKVIQTLKVLESLVIC